MLKDGQHEILTYVCLERRIWKLEWNKEKVNITGQDNFLSMEAKDVLKENRIAFAYE